MRKRWLNYILLSIIGLGLITALFLAWQRHQVEAANHQVELAVDWQQIKTTARDENLTAGQALEKMQGTVTGVIFKEETVKDLAADGRVIIRKGSEISWEFQMKTGSGLIPVQNPMVSQIHPDWYYLIFSDPKLMSRVSANLSLKNKGQGKTESLYLQTSQRAIPILATSLPEEDLINTGVGFDEAGLDLAQAKGFDIVPQIRSWQDVDSQSIALTFGQLKGRPVSAVFFNDEDLPGIGLSAKKQKEAITEIAGAVESLDVPLGMIEFFPQKGLATLAGDLDNNLVRMHAIPEDEMETMSQSKAVDRFTLAATDRDIRVLFARFLPGMKLHDNILYLKDIKDSLTKNGFSLGQPAAYGNLAAAPLLLLVLAAAVAAGGILLLSVLGYEKTGLLIGILGLLGSAVLILAGHALLARKGLALLAVIIFPTLSVAVNLKDKPAGILACLGIFLRTTLFSLAGALLMVGLLADRSFMYTLNQFMGVKLAHALPLLLLIIIFWFLRDRENSPLKKIVRILDYPVQVKYLALLGILGVVLVIYMLRTGNENAAVPAWELMIRSKLEYLLAVRPRTKEFLIGHPLMILLFYLGYRDRYLPLLLIGAIGQVSVVNTFAHIHTPLAISMLRAFNGVWLGILFGLGLILVYSLCLGLVKRWGTAGR